MQTLKYGLPCFEVKNLSASESFLDGMFTELCEIVPNTRIEFLSIQLKRLQEILSSCYDCNKELIKRYKQYDRDIAGYFMGFSDDDENFSKINKDLVLRITSDVWPVIYKIKIKHNHPRPFQIADNLDFKIYPYSSITSHCPSFPSMHSAISYIIAEVIGNKFPKYYSFYKQTAEDITRSRLYLGLCLEQDTEAGIEVARRILNNKEFIVKYGL